MRRARPWIALLLAIGFSLVLDPVQDTFVHWVRHPLNLHTFGPGGVLATGPFAVMALVRLSVSVGFFFVVCLLLGQSPLGFPIGTPGAGKRLGAGLAVGLAVMTGLMCVILALGDGAARPTDQSAATSLVHGVGWLLDNLIIAAAEELYTRGAILLVVTRLAGWRVAVLASGAAFVLFHLGNPGASAIWLIRLFVQGALLAYAVFRTRSIWWSVGYHAGWNWASAPLFGAAGSGYLDQGHLMTFTATGPALITGGDVGPEGSILAFAAMAAALGCLLWLTRRDPPPSTLPRA
jgi:uncharacterized protein